MAAQLISEQGGICSQSVLAFLCCFSLHSGTGHSPLRLRPARSLSYPRIQVHGINPVQRGRFIARPTTKNKYPLQMTQCHQIQGTYTVSSDTLGALILGTTSWFTPMVTTTLKSTFSLQTHGPGGGRCCPPELLTPH